MQKDLLPLPSTRRTNCSPYSFLCTSGGISPYNASLLVTKSFTKFATVVGGLALHVTCSVVKLDSLHFKHSLVLVLSTVYTDSLFTDLFTGPVARALKAFYLLTPSIEINGELQSFVGLFGFGAQRFLLFYY